MGIEDNLQKVTAGFRAVNARDFDGFISLLDPEYHFQLVLKPQMIPTMGTVNNPEGLRSHFNLMFEGFPDFHMDEITLRANGNMVYHEVMIHATHTSSIALPSGITIPATGRRVRMPVEVYHTFDPAGRYLSSTVHVDMLDVLKQIGTH